MDNILLYVNVALILCQICVLAMLLIARARVVSVEKALVDLDWESVATIVGDLATVKRTVQKLNLRLNGMESIDPNKVLAKLQNVTGNVTPITQPQKPSGG
jgi:DNA-binding SARP family transcriptional activator